MKGPERLCLVTDANRALDMPPGDIGSDHERQVHGLRAMAGSDLSRARDLRARLLEWIAWCGKW